MRAVHMRKMSVIRGTALFCIAVAMFVAILVLLVSVSLYPLLYSDIYITSLDSAGAFSYAEEQLNAVPMASFIKIPASGVKEIATRLLTGVLAYMRSDTNELALNVQIDQEKLKTFFLDSINNVSVCGKGQRYSFDSLDSLCRPANKSANELLDELLVAKNLSFFERDTVDLVSVYGLEEGSAGRLNLDNFRRYFLYYRYVIFVSALCVVLLGGIVFLLKRRSLKGFMRWTGFTFVLAGAVALVGALFGASAFKGYIATVQYPLLPEFANSLVSAIARNVFLYAAIAGIIGLFLIVFSFLMPSAKSNIKK